MIAIRRHLLNRDSEHFEISIWDLAREGDKEMKTEH